MCGLVGIISKWSTGFLQRDVTIFEELLYIDALRGDDATGVAVISKFQGASVFKEASHANWFLSDKEYLKARETFTTETKALLGHNRKATSGGRKDEQAHPFVIDDRFVFFHNGTLTAHKHLHNTEVDSEALGMVLSRCEGDSGKLSEALSRISGAYACVWYDVEKHTIYFLRNAQRPLYLGITDSGDIYYASEAWMYYGSGVRNHTKIKESKLIDVDTLYEVSLDDVSLTIKETKLPKKVQLPLPTPSKAAITTLGGASSTITEFFTKKELRRTVADLKKSDYFAFGVEEAICSSDQDPINSCCYDWLILGTLEEYPGAVFKAVVKDKFPYEVEELYNKLAHGYVDDIEVKNNRVVVTIKQVTFSKTKVMH